MRLTFPRIVRPFALTIALLSCTENGPVGPTLDPSSHFNVAGSSQSVVISQVYGGGGNSGATIKNDFIEIFNNGIDAVDLTNWSLQYGSTAGNFNSSPNVPTPLSGTLAPGHYLLIQEGAGAGGTISIAADITAPAPIAMSATDAKVALVRSTTALTCGATATPCAPAALTNVADLIGFGTANLFEGTAAAQGLTNTTSHFRAGGGCTDTNQNAADFARAAPVPRNSATAANVCGGVVSVVDHIVVAPVMAPAAGTVAVGSTLQFNATVFDSHNTDITAANPVTWSTSPTGFANVDGTGLATGTSVGSTTVVAAVGTITGNAPLTVTAAAPVESGDIVISQIYGGGGNTSAQYQNDYVELLNRGSVAVNLSGWAVQYNSATSISPAAWQVTPLSGTIQPGHYLLVQEGSGAGAGVVLPTPEVSGSILMAAGAGKVILIQSITAQTATCPSTGVVDRVGYGAANCGTDWGGTTPALSNTTAAFRNNDGCTNTNNVGSDFTVAAPSPRNSSSPQKSCPPPVPLPSVHFSELHYDNIGTDVNEKIEIEGPADQDLTGWSVVLYGGDAVPAFSAYSTTTLGVALPTSCGTTGVIVVSYAVNGIKNAKFNPTDNPAGMALVDNTGHVVEFLSYEGTFTALDGPAAGMVSTDIGVAEEPPPAPGNSLHRNSAGFWSAASAQDFGVCNGTGGPPPESTNHFTFTGRLASDQPLPVGFEDQLFATEHDGATNAVINTTVTWSSDTPGIATIDGDGVFRGVSAGTAILRATATDGTTTTTSLPVVTNTFSTTADWSGNLEFGTPTDAHPDDDFIITHDQFTSSYSLARNIPNWVSAKLDASHYGTNSDRCDCFTFDPAVPSSLYYTTNAWTGVGSTWNRGHLLRSADVESTPGDNSIAYYFSNIAPQSAQMNTGPWAVEEIFLGTMAKTGGKDVYQIVGVSGSVGTLKGEGTVTIPGYFWKVAVIVPHGRKLADIHSPGDLEVISVIMPNIATVNSNWETYKTTVHAVEELSGYNLLDRLPDDIELLVEDAAPRAVVGPDQTGIEGTSVSFDASNSTDADDDHISLSYAWDFGDGTTGSGAKPSHTYANNGEYLVNLTVTDPRGGTGTASSLVTVSNVNPSVTIASSGPIASGATYSLPGNFTDPGTADAPWSYTINWGDGFSSVTTTTTSQGALGGTHKYLSAGSYTVALTVIDKDGGSGSASTTVLVEDAAPIAVAGDDRTGIEGSSVSFDGSNSTDADDDTDHLSYAWDFGDGMTGTGVKPSHAYADNGQYIINLTVTDPHGRAGTASSVVTVSNVNPSVTIGSSGPVVSGATYSLPGNFTDPGLTDSPWSYTINWGDGSSSGITSSQGALVRTHTYFTAGTYIVTLTVADKDGGSGSASTTLQVSRILGSMSVTPSPINIGNNGNGQVIVTVFGTSAFDGTAINLSTARIGSTAVDVLGNSNPKGKFKDVNNDGILDLVLHFVRGDLVANGDLSSNTLFLALDANLTDGRQIEVRGPVEVTSNATQQ